MKKLLSIITLGAVALALPASGIAAEKKAKTPAAPAAAAPAAAPAEGAKKPAAEAGAPKPIPMNSKVDEIDAKAKTFSHKNKDGAVVKNVVTDKTEIKNGESAAKFEDIKVGDTVSGLRLKKSATEYEVLKITKFGIAPPKEKKPEGAAKPEAPKKP
jgi:hypothetical protein